jgi:hypothetical protein
MKKWIIICIAVFFVALIVSGYFILTSSFALGKVRSIAESTIQDMFKREATVGEITGNPLRGISINGISVAKNDRLSEGKLIEIQTIEAKYSLISLLKSKIVINNLKIIQPRIWVEMDKNGKLNIPKFVGKSRFTVLNAEISSGQVDFDDKRDLVHLTIYGINVSISREEDKSKGEIKAVKAELSLLNVTKHISEMVAFFEASDDTITLSRLELRMMDSVFWAKGELIKGEVSKLDANIKTKLALNDFKEFAPQFKRLDGIVDVNITAKGKMSDISSICKIDSKSLYLNDLKINDLKGNVKFSQKGVELSGISANIGGGKAGIIGTAKLTGGKLHSYKGDVRLSNLDTYNILSGLTSTKSPLSGALNGRILISGKELRTGAFQTKGDLKLTDLRVKISQNQNKPSLPQYKDVPVGNIKASLNVNGEIGVSGKVTELNGSGKMLVSDLSVGTRSIDPVIIPITIQSNVLKIPEFVISSIGEQIKVACELRPSGDYTLKIDSLPIDIAKLCKDVMSTPNDGEIIIIEKAVAPGGKLQISLSGMGNFRLPYLDNKIKLDVIRYNDDSFGNGEFIINVGNKKVSLDLYSQDRILVANVDASIKSPFPFTIQLQLRDIDIKPFLKLANIGSKAVSMHITSDINAHGDWAKLIDLSMDGTLQNILLTTSQNKWVSKSPANINLTDRKFKLDSLQMDSKNESIPLNAIADLISSQKESKIELEINANIKNYDLSDIKKFYLVFNPYRPVNNYYVMGVIIAMRLNLWVFR